MFSVISFVHFTLLLSLASGFSFGKGTRSRCRKPCGKDISPVCGSDGFIYSSMCELKQSNCKSKENALSELFLVPDKHCMRSSGSSCDHKCTNQYDPVCGSNGRTYINKCIFRVEKCRSGISFAHYGPCITALNRTASCPETCADSPKDGPICASDGNVYNSTCDMVLRTCGQKVVKTTYNHCQTTKSCQDVCFYDYKPVCGSDGRIYQSRCQMRVKNCGKHIYETPMVHCRPQERTTTSCPISCDGEKLSPVCASDGNIYDSVCEMKKLNCGSGNALNIFVVDLKKCRKRFQTCEKIICPGSYDPVCGTDGQTYINYCLLHKATCKKGVELAHYGKCAGIEPDDCDTPCLHLTADDMFPVCGSDGNVYESVCQMKKRTCGQKVVPVALHHCEATKNCLSECKNEQDGAAVCGSDKKMYRNACEMKAKNCGRHVYEVPLGECLKGFNFFRCMRFCPPVFDPVCGTDGKTYSNECFLKMENCRSRSLGRSLVTRTYYGKCGNPQPQPKLYMFR